jgi:DNA invertase Pin-like site-specific DNA recombinase
MSSASTSIRGTHHRVRPEFERMLKDARDGKFAVVLAEDVDPIARDLATAAKLDDILATPPCSFRTRAMPQFPASFARQANALRTFPRSTPTVAQ